MAIFIVVLEVILFFAFLNRKTKIGKKITIFLMKKQGIPRIMTMEEIDERIDEIVNSSDEDE